MKAPGLAVRLIGALLLAPSAARAQVVPDSDRIRIAEVYRLANQMRGQVWQGWEAAPFALLLVTPEVEYLIRHPKPDSSFRPAGYDSLLHSEVYVRDRVFPTNLLATFPTGAGVPTIVMGRPGPTGRSSAQWVITALHEHFHQLQMSSPGYFAGVESLELSHGDQSGRWMLEYPFPYQSAPVRDAFAAVAESLLRALEGVETERLEDWLAGYRAAQASLRQLLTAEEYRYYAFQLWQEGIARYVEYQVARYAAEAYRPTPELQAFPDYLQFAAVAESLHDDIYGGIRGADLSASGRANLYAVGAATALVLDRIAPGWQGQYLERRFDLDRYFPSP